METTNYPLQQWPRQRDTKSWLDVNNGLEELRDETSNIQWRNWRPEFDWELKVSSTHLIVLTLCFQGVCIAERWNGVYILRLGWCRLPISPAGKKSDYASHFPRLSLLTKGGFSFMWGHLQQILSRKHIILRTICRITCTDNFPLQLFLKQLRKE